jgi:limonene-1,2-epoxide hydrolase
MKKVVLAAVVLLLCASGCKHSHPGFTKVTGADDVSYFIKLDSITRTDIAIQFQLLREAKDGSYIVQSAATFHLLSSPTSIRRAVSGRPVFRLP